MENYQKVYEEFWKDIVENEDGTLNKDQVMRELADYSVILKSVPEVYIEVANLSKPLTKPEVIISNLNEKWVRKEYILDDLKDFLDEDDKIDYQDLVDYLT